MDCVNPITRNIIMHEPEGYKEIVTDEELMKVNGSPGQDGNNGNQAQDEGDQ